MEKPDIPRGQFLELSKLRPQIWFFDLILNWAIIAGIFYLFHLADTYWVIPIAALLIGARQHALGLLTHDGTHRCALKHKKLNDVITEVFTGWPILVKVDHGYRQWHFDHHRELGTDKDPELNYRNDKAYQTPVSFRKICFLFVSDMIGLGIIDMLKFFREIFPRNPLHFAGPILMWGAFFALTFTFDALWIFYLWTWSLITGFWAVFRVRTWSEHVGVEADGLHKSHRFSAGPIARFLFFPHNTFCHYEHHLWSQIPYYNLPKLRELDKTTEIISAGDLFWNFQRYNG